MSTSSDEKITETEKAALELQRLRKEVEKLALEVEALRTSSWWDRMIGRYLPIVTALLAVAGFWVGLVESYHQRKDAEQQRVSADQRRTLELRREAAKPFWDTQLSLYIKASDAAATIATTGDPKVRERAEATFWTMYWGPLSCVEDITLDEQSSAKVEAAMVRFGAQLQTAPEDVPSLRGLALNIAHAMRDQISPSFNLKAAPLGPSGTKK